MHPTVRAVFRAARWAAMVALAVCTSTFGFAAPEAGTGRSTGAGLAAASDTADHDPKAATAEHSPKAEHSPNKELRIPPAEFQIVPRDSGPINYYSVVDAPTGPYIHSAYRPPYETAVLGYAVPDELRRSVTKIRWRWRARVLPVGGDECTDGKQDSAAVVYVIWRRTLRWYAIKYVWSAVGPKGRICDLKRNMFRAQDTVIVESGGPLGEWRTFEIDPDYEFRTHFADGDAGADVPQLGGIGLMSDGDQTQSSSEADFADFVLAYD
jgi:hypothetical protein